MNLASLYSKNEEYILTSSSLSLKILALSIVYSFNNLYTTSQKKILYTNSDIYCV